MKQRWTLRVEGFGKIKKAEIKLRPFMMFVGDNNSGKSFMMSLLWGIMSLSGSILPVEKPNSELYKKCEQWFMDNLSKDEIVVDEMAQDQLLAWFNEHLENSRNELVKQIFNYDVEIERLEITDYLCALPVKVSLNKNGFYRYTEDDKQITISIPSAVKEVGDQIYFALRYVCWSFMMGNIIESFNNPLYLPASRTGFMLTYKSIIRSLIDIQFGVQKNARQELNRLSLPVSRFLSDLTDVDFQGGSRYINVANFLEKEILHGEITKDSSPVPNYLYKPEDLGTEIPLHVTSSLVTELSPIVLFLKASGIPFYSLIIEEPEAHLNLDLQRQMSRAIVRLVNMGLPVWITTHSDTMFQQLNNLMRLYKRPDREQLAQKYGYEKEDFLDPSQASAYQFRVNQDGKTEVEPLKSTEYGFAAPTFNETIISLTKETIEFQETDSDDE